MTQRVQPQGFNLSGVLPCRQVRPFDDSMPAEAAVVRIAQASPPGCGFGAAASSSCLIKYSGRALISSKSCAR